MIACEVKQEETIEAVADSLSRDAHALGAWRALLAVLRPGLLIRFDRTSVIQRAERDHGVVLRVTDGVRELLHEAVAAGTVNLEEFRSTLPRDFGDALREMRVTNDAIETWVAIAKRWS